MLPNLPGLASQWHTGFRTVPILVGQWTEIVPPDAMRWALVILAGNGGLLQVWFNPELTMQEGFTIQPTTPLVLHYKDWGPLMQGAIYAIDQVGKGVASYAFADITLQPDPAVAAGREGGN